jgi:L-alanine-DL-glutamate epimerase-like enolase superfamily enzyme
MKVTAVHVETLELPLDAPFVIASSALAANPCDLVRVETDEGLVGFGEACPGYEFTGDTLWSVQDVIGEYLGPSVVGRDPFDIEAIVRRWERDLFTVGNQAARGGLEMALWDLQGKALGRSLCDLLGGRSHDGLVEEVTWGWDTPEALAEKTRRTRDEGVAAYKVKAGDTPERDEQRVAAVREAAGPSARITVDANQGWRDARTAVRAIRLLEPHDVAFVEQPVPIDELEAARFVRERVDVPIALDESVRGPREALACVKAGACDVFVLKLMKTGGILGALKVNAIAEAAGIPVTMGNMG